MPTGVEEQIYMNSEGVKAKVISVINTRMYSTGLILQGDQECLLEIQSGSFKGAQIHAINLFTGRI